MCFINDYVPYLKREGKSGIVMNFKAVMEGLIGPAIVGLVMLYGMQGKDSVRLDMLVDDVAEIKREVKEIRKDVYKPR